MTAYNPLTPLRCSFLNWGLWQSLGYTPVLCYKRGWEQILVSRGFKMWELLKHREDVEKLMWVITRFGEWHQFEFMGNLLSRMEAGNRVTRYFCHWCLTKSGLGSRWLSAVRRVLQFWVCRASRSWLIGLLQQKSPDDSCLEWMGITTVNKGCLLAQTLGSLFSFRFEEMRTEADGHGMAALTAQVLVFWAWSRQFSDAQATCPQWILTVTRMGRLQRLNTSTAGYC